MRTKLPLIIVALLIGKAQAQSGDRMSMQCKEPPAASLEEQLARINREGVKSDAARLECAFFYLDNLSRAKDSRALPLIAQYLDVPNPRSAAANPIGGHALFGGEYPAIDYIVSYRKAALPTLLDCIEKEPGLTVRARNAVQALMVIEAPDPPGGVRLLVETANNASGAQAKALSQAAQFATKTWQCHLILAKCEEALAGGTPPTPPRTKPQ